MLKILSLKLKNFMNIDEAYFEFSNYNFIYGQPASGKSAIFEAIRLCISDLKRASTYSAYIKQGCEYSNIELSVLLDESIALFKITLNSPKAGTPFEGVLTYKDQTYKNSKLHDFIKSTSIDYYANIMFMMQNDDDIVDMTPSARLFYMQNLFNFDFKDEKKKLSDMISSNKEDLLKLEAQKSSFKELKQVFSQKETIDFSLFSNDEINEINNKISSLNDEVSLALKENTEKQSIENNILNLKKKKLFIENEINNLKKIKENVNTVENLKIDLKNQNEKFNTYKTEISSLEEENKNISKNIELLNNEKSNLLDKKNDILLKKTQYDYKVELIKKGFCPECGQKTDHLDNNAIFYASKYKSELDEILIKISEKENSIKNYQDSLNNNNTKLNEYNKNLNKLKSDIDIFNYKINSLDTNFDNDKFSSFMHDLDDINNNLLDLESKLSKLSTRDISSLYKEINDLKEKLSSNNIKIEKAKNIANNNKNNEIKLKELKESESKIDLLIQECNKKQLSYNDANDIITKLLPQYMSLQICKFIQEKMNFFIKNIFPNYTIRVDVTKKGCELFYTKDNSVSNETLNKWINAKMSSGFERAVLNLAFKTVLAEFYGIDLFIGDEIDKAASDEDSIRIINLIWALSNYKQIFIISHNSSLKNYVIDNIEDCNIYEASFGKFIKNN